MLNASGRTLNDSAERSRLQTGRLPLPNASDDLSQLKVNGKVFAEGESDEEIRQP